MKIVVSFCMATSFLVATEVSAARFGGAVYGGFNTYSMKDWNDVLDDANAAGADFDNVGNGFTAGVELRAWVTRRWRISAGWEPLLLDDVTNGNSTNPGGYLSLDGHAFSATGAYFFVPASGRMKATTPGAAKARTEPVRPSGSRYGLGAGLDVILNRGEIASIIDPLIRIEGSSIGFHVLGLGEWPLIPGYAVTASAGYRFGKVSRTDVVLGEERQDSTADTDYSGLILRAGIAFDLPGGTP
ncbi:MAG TPA: hypothetical protein VJ826_15440 [Candidatus Polarisedimenticolaceae bacterium]|nr:hypothetical protein [Candidatus Polarisedimenticolaceae bacterium]